MNMNIRSLFLEHVAQTSDSPMLGVHIDIEYAKGAWLYDYNKRAYLDLISGISVSSIGHCHPKVQAAISNQTARFAHLMVFGEFAQQPQVHYMQRLMPYLPPSLNSIYYCNSGSEAIEGALKLAKRATGRTQIISFKNAYHGSTHGALSLCSDFNFTKHSLPLMPDIHYLTFNCTADLDHINEKTAAVVFEYIQAESGINTIELDFLNALTARCKHYGVLLIADEIQSGFGRCGSFFAHQRFNHTPDILVLAKAMGGGLPIGAFIAPKSLMHTLSFNPSLGHLTTFGGNAVCIAAAYAVLEVLQEEKLVERARTIEHCIKTHLSSSHIAHLRVEGAWAAVEFKTTETCFKIIKSALQNGLITDWFLFNSKALRLSPPLNIPLQDLKNALQQLNLIIDHG